VQRNYYFPWIPLIVGLSIGIPLFALAVYFIYKRFNERKPPFPQPIEPNLKSEEPSRAIESPQQSTKYEFCPKCGAKITIGKFCQNCGFDISKL